MIPKKKTTIGILVILIVATLLVLIALRIWEIKQSSIHITPEEAITKFQGAGYSITNIMYEEYVPGPIAFPQYAMRFNIQSENQKYSVYIALFDNWQLAKDSEKSVNALNRRMNGGYAYGFYCGEVFLQIIPSHKMMGLRLLSTLCKTE
jgi:hypothetical protein